MLHAEPYGQQPVEKRPRGIFQPSPSAKQASHGSPGLRLRRTFFPRSEKQFSRGGNSYLPNASDQRGRSLKNASAGRDKLRCREPLHLACVLPLIGETARLSSSV